MASSVAWQKIDRRALPTLRLHHRQFEPYCHLDIVDMWSYRGGPNHWFKLGDTIVYRLNDYMDNSLYLTVLGQESVREAVKELCRKNKHHKKLTLRCLPEQTLKAFGNWPAIVSASEDHDNHDYVLDVDALVNFSTPELQHQQRLYRKLLRRHPNLHVKVLDHNKPSDRRLLYRAFKRWVTQTGADGWHKEFLALKRALNLKGVGLVCLGFFDGRKLIGYTINEAQEGGAYYQGFFGKVDRRYPGLGVMIEHETAKYFKEHYGSKLFNMQPDSGIVGLRYYKSSFGPLKKLKKYTVVVDTAKALAN